MPHGALEFLRGNVRRSIPLAALPRSYRLGHAWPWERWSHELREYVARGDLGVKTGRGLYDDYAAGA